MSNSAPRMGVRDSAGETWSSSNLAPAVAHFADCFLHKSENWIYTQLKHLRHHAPFVLTRRTKNLAQLDWVPPYYKTFGRSFPERAVDRFGQTFFGYRPTLRWQLYRRGAHLIHAHFGPAGYDVLSLAEAHGVPLVTTFYGYDLSLLPNKDPAWKDRYETLFARGDRFLTEGSHMKQRLVELGCPEDKITVQHLGVEMETIPSRPRSRSEGEPLRVLAVGRFVEKKGFPDAVRAFARFLNQGGEGVFTIVGGRRNEEEDRAVRNDLRQIAAQEGVEEHLTFAGFLSHEELIETYLDHHVLLSPSVQAANGDNEGGAPVTLIEASATGMPVVSTRHCDIPEVVKHRDTGLLAEEGDVETLANHLRVLFQNPDRLTEMGQAGHQHMVENYSARKQGERLDQIYRAVWDADAHE